MDLSLGWVPRESNVEADALTEERFEGFAPELRVRVAWDAVPWLVLPGLMAAAGELFTLSEERRRGRKSLGSPRPSEGTPGKRPRPAGSLRVSDPW